LVYDPQSRINSFAHVNHTANDPRIGVLLCINGCGTLNKSIRRLAGGPLGYEAINKEAESVPSGSEGLIILPFGNGSERMLGNKHIGAVIDGWDFNIHQAAHFYRSAQEGVAFAFRYGLDIMIENGISPMVIRAGHNNMFLSNVFTRSLVNILNLPVEIYRTDGALGAALGAGVGLKLIGQNDLGNGLSLITTVTPKTDYAINEAYLRWVDLLKRHLGT
jgi:xylulokinase